MNIEQPAIAYDPIPLLDLNAQYRTISEEIEKALKRVVHSQTFILGAEVRALEEEIASYLGCAYAIGVSSGTDALLLSLLALEIQPGDEIITTPYTFRATSEAILRVGAKPVFVDIEEASYNLDARLVESLITEHTKAIMPVHLFGQAVDMDTLMKLASHYSLVVIEDAAQAIGAKYHDQHVGTIGTLGCFSFFPSKNLGGYGDGGMVTTNDPDLAARIKQLRNHGYIVQKQIYGGNFRLDELQAAILRVKLRSLDKWTQLRRSHAEDYTTRFVHLRGSSTEYTSSRFQPHLDLVLPVQADGCYHVYNQFVIRTPFRDALLRHLDERHIGCRVYYPTPLHVDESFVSLGYQAGNLPQSERAARETVAIPIYPELTGEMITTVAETIFHFLVQQGEETR